MPISVRSDEAPALFMVRDKKLTLVNYRIRGRWYIADRIMDRARLVIRDHDNIQKVEIIRHNRTSWWRKILPFV
jgi:type IV secretory pathway VirB9-like protein